MKYDDLQLLLKHQDESLIVVAALMRASLEALVAINLNIGWPE